MGVLDKFLRLAADAAGGDGAPVEPGAADTPAQDVAEIIAGLADLSDGDIQKLDTALDKEMNKRGLDDSESDGK